MTINLLKIHRDAAAPDFAGRRFSRWFKKHPSPATGRKILYFHGCGTEYYEPWEGEKVVAILEHNGFEVDRAQAGLLRPAAAVERAVRRRAQGRAAARARARAVPARRPEPDHRRQRHQLHADAQARGARDPLARGRPRSEAACPSAPTTSASCCSSCTTAASCKTDFKPVNERIFYHAPCQQQGHWIGKPALELFALIPGLRGRRGERALLRNRRDLRAEGREVRHRDGGRQRTCSARFASPGPATVACDSETCRWQISHATGSQVGAPDRLPAPRLRALRAGSWSGSSSCPTATRWPRAWSRSRARWVARSWRLMRRRRNRRAGRARDRRRARDGGDRAARCPPTACSC